MAVSHIEINTFLVHVITAASSIINNKFKKCNRNILTEQNQSSWALLGP